MTSLLPPKACSLSPLYAALSNFFTFECASDTSVVVLSPTLAATQID